MYLLGYGIGRFWIEGLGTDQLILFGTGLAVSQMLALAMVLISSITIYLLRKRSTKKESR